MSIEGVILTLNVVLVHGNQIPSAHLLKFQFKSMSKYFQLIHTHSLSGYNVYVISVRKTFIRGCTMFVCESVALFAYALHHACQKAFNNVHTQRT